MNASELLEFHWKAIGRYDSYIVTTNTKAAFLIAWNTFVIGTIALKWHDLLAPFAGMLWIHVWASLCLLAVLLAGLASLWETFRVVNPFIDSPKRPLKYQSLIFFAMSLNSVRIWNLARTPLTEALTTSSRTSQPKPTL